MMNRCRLLLAAFFLLLPALALAQDSAGDMLGPVFESASAGIALRRPANCREILKGGGGEIVEFLNEGQNLQLRLARTILRSPMPLSTTKDSAGRETAGLLEITTEQFKSTSPDAQILRQDVVNIADANVGMLAVRYTAGARRKLTQQALIAANDRLYYVLTLTTPASKTAESTPEEKQAVELFTQVLNSVRLLDTAPIRADQENRLYRTRAFLVNLTEARLKAALIPQQWWRLIRDGKDIGYTYIVEEIDKRGGVLISLRARTIPIPQTQVDVGSQLFSGFDRRHETWASIAETQHDKDRSQTSEFGASDKLLRRVLDPRLASNRRDGEDPKQPPVRQIETYTLNVTTISKSTSNEPLVRQLPPWYLPQAVGHLLPRLLPPNEPKTYLFSTYVSDRREVMSRYVEVEPEQAVVFAGKHQRAIPIKDRIGLDGIVTTHYISPSGQLLGSQTTYTDADGKSTTLLMLPSDADTLKRLWANARLTRPDEQEFHRGKTRSR